jgi:arylsulfatase A-like enzyme
MEGGIRVPFIISGPNIESNTYSNVRISFSDLLPTIIDLAGNKKLINKKLDGGSFKNILHGKKTKVKRNINGLIFHVPYKNKIALDRPHSAIIINDMKLIKFYDNSEIRLYDLSYDLSESLDLSTKKIRLARKLEKKLENYLSSVKAPKWKPGITWKKGNISSINSFH